MDEIITAISTVGFPIVATLILSYLLLQEKDTHKEEMLELRKSIESNTLVMSELKILITEMRNEKVSVRNETSKN